MEIIKEWLKTIAYAFVIVLALYFFAWPVTIEGESMEPTFLDGDKVVTSRFFTMTGKYEAGDIVVFHMIDIDGERDVIKRVIGKAGDSIEIKNGAVYRNGVLISEEYVKDTTEGEVSLIVPKGGIFVLGDNRNHSYDSRKIGIISESELKGKVILRWYPFRSIKKF
ncbi:signal peptidase I [Lachnospiraceae bacterium 46-61]